MEKNSKILVLGSRGLVGSAIVRELEKEGYENILKPLHKELDLTIQAEVLSYFEKERPDYVFLAAAKVGGIHANNTYRADFIWQNLSMEVNVFEAAHKYDVKKLLFLGSSCIYPKNCPQPIKEEYLLTSELEQTNEPYAIAKIAGLKMAENFRRQYGKNFIAVMPTNIYGINDNFHPENSHVIPGMIQRLQKVIDERKVSFDVWGSGMPKREFLFADDLADACVFLMNYEGELPYWINVGTGYDLTIRELAETICDIMGFKEKIIFNTEKPDGTPRKVLDISKIQALGWNPKTSLRDGIQKSVAFYREQVKHIKCDQVELIL